jgi:hypothetical protein
MKRREFLKSCAALSALAVMPFNGLFAEDPFAEYCKGVKVFDPRKGSRVPFELRPELMNIAHEFENNRLVIFKKYRQGGFSTLALVYLRWRMEQQKCRVLYFQNYDRCCRGSKYDFIHLAPETIKITSENSNEVEFANGSNILFSPPSCVCGRSCDYIIFDEAAYIDNAKQWWKAYYPTISCGGKAFVFSTPNGTKERGQWFHDTYKQAELGQNSFKVVPTDYRNSRNICDNLNFYKAQLGSKGFRAEVLAEFI